MNAAAELFVVGTSQSVASAGMRERMYVELEDLYRELRFLRGTVGIIEEAVPLFTCGRMELYCLSPRPLRALKVLRQAISVRSGLSQDELTLHSYTLWGDQAARHLFRVAAGLDSVIYGEAQILGQVRDALFHPGTEDVGGSFLRRLFQSALATGKRVRTETEIGRGSASVAGAALCLLEAEAGTFQDKSALVLGAGETGELVARLLHKEGVGELTILNRTRSRAERLANELGGAAGTLEELPARLPAADIIVGAVADRGDLANADMLGGAQACQGRRRFILDLAHPRNFPEGLAAVPGVTLLDLAQVFERVDEAKMARQAQVPRAETIVDAEVEAFAAWVRSRQSAPILRAVREQVLAMAQEEAAKRSRGRTPEEQEELTSFARSLARTLLHAPTVAIRDADPGTAEGRWILRTATSLFGLGEEGRSSREGAS